MTPRARAPSQMTDITAFCRLHADAVEHNNFLLANIYYSVIVRLCEERLGWREVRHA